jgi:hypothetical protein
LVAEEGFALISWKRLFEIPSLGQWHFGSAGGDHYTPRGLTCCVACGEIFPGMMTFSEFELLVGSNPDGVVLATALTLGLPLMTADKEIIEWNKAHSAIQILNL